MAISDAKSEEKFSDTLHAIVAINPDAQVTVYAPDLRIEGSAETIIWNKDTPVISDADIAAKKVELKAEWTSQEYSRNRQEDYPNPGQQFEKIYDDGVTKWKTEMVDPVKAKWPKDNSGPV